MPLGSRNQAGMALSAVKQNYVDLGFVAQFGLRLDFPLTPDGFSLQSLFGECQKQ